MATTALGWARLKPGASNSTQVPHVVAGTPVPVPPSGSQDLPRLNLKQGKPTLQDPAGTQSQEWTVAPGPWDRSGAHFALAGDKCNWPSEGEVLGGSAGGQGLPRHRECVREVIPSAG